MGIKISTALREVEKYMPEVEDDRMDYKIPAVFIFYHGDVTHLDFSPQDSSGTIYFKIKPETTLKEFQVEVKEKMAQLKEFQVEIKEKMAQLKEFQVEVKEKMAHLK